MARPMPVGEDEGPNDVQQLRTAFSGSTISARNHAIEEFMHSRAHPDEQFKRAGSAPGLSREDQDDMPKISIGVCGTFKNNILFITAFVITL